MDQIKRSDIPVQLASGQYEWDAFGSEAYIKSTDASMSYRRITPEHASAAYTSHEQSVLFVVEAKDALLTYGETAQTMVRRAGLEAGTVLRVHKGEWYGFDFSSSDGFAELIAFSPTPAARIFQYATVQE